MDIKLKFLFLFGFLKVVAPYSAIATTPYTSTTKSWYYVTQQVTQFYPSDTLQNSP